MAVGSTKDAVRQGAGVEELLAVFDVARVEHAGMPAEAFNDDGTYKTCINQVKTMTPSPPPILLLGFAPAVDFSC